MIMNESETLSHNFNLLATVLIRVKSSGRAQRSHWKAKASKDERVLKARTARTELGPNDWLLHAVAAVATRVNRYLAKGDCGDTL